jgi:hypothetical protein
MVGRESNDKGGTRVCIDGWYQCKPVVDEALGSYWQWLDAGWRGLLLQDTFCLHQMTDRS